MGRLAQTLGPSKTNRAIPHTIRNNNRDLDPMNFEMFGSGCFGLVIGFVAWHVFQAAGHGLDIKQLAAFVGALLGAAVLSAFPAGTTLFAAYSVGLAAGFFFKPILQSQRSMLISVIEGMNMVYEPDHSDFPSQMKYLDEKWPEVEFLISAELGRRGGKVKHNDLVALPLSESGRVNAMKKFARIYPEKVIILSGLFGWKLEKVAGHALT